MRDGSATKTLIEDTALHLFVERGITETTIRDISSAAGISEGAMYRHYPSKEDLAWGLFSKNIEAMAIELDHVRKKHSTLKDRNEAMVRGACRLFGRDPTMFNYVVLSQHAQHKKLTPNMRSPFKVFRDAIAEGIKKREIPKGEPIFLASMVMGMFRDVAVQKLAGTLKMDLAKIEDALVIASWQVLSTKY